MKLIILSDTHIKPGRSLLALLPKDLISILKSSDMIIHRGQLTSGSTDGLRYLAREMGVDILVFGHFHHPIVEKTDVLLLSPGSATVPGIAEPSAMELEITGNKVKGRIIRCRDNVCSYFEYETH